MSPPFISFVDCLVAYRKAKAEAYYENTHFHAMAFAEYEKNLIGNLQALLARLTTDSPTWSSDFNWIGSYSYAPKSVGSPVADEDEEIHFRFLDPLDEWRRKCGRRPRNRPKASFRLIIRPTVDFQITSALWILKVGDKFDLAVNRSVSYGNRLRRRRRSRDAAAEADDFDGPINLDCCGLFSPYYSAYRRWRENGLNAISTSLADGQDVLAITMDLRQFYHRADPRFILRERYLEATGIRLTNQQMAFTRSLLEAIETWYRQTPDAKERPGCALPVGLSASKIIANAMLVDLDRALSRDVEPVYYGRYVDDVFLVLPAGEGLSSGQAVVERILAASPEILKKYRGEEGDSGIRVSLPYAKDSLLIFGTDKQKIFSLSGKHGLDLMAQIREQIRRQSSEHRLLPIVPETGEEMAARAFLAQPTASLEADALRKADVISVKRLGLSLLLRDMEAYARDIWPSRWRDRRAEFYGLVHRHVITPEGFFEYFPYILRTFSLSIACNDFDEAKRLIQRLSDVVSVIAETTTAGTDNALRFEYCRQHYGHALVQVALQAASDSRFRWSRGFEAAIGAIRLVCKTVSIPLSSDSTRRLASDLFYADFGRRPYRSAWLSRAKRDRANLPVPKGFDVQRVLRLGAIRTFRTEAGLQQPYWLAVVFPTRPMSLAEITAAAPKLLYQPAKLRTALFALRGARARKGEGVGLVQSSLRGRAPELLVQDVPRRMPRIAVPSLATEDADYKAALNRRPSLTLVRYERFVRLINQMCRQSPRPQYVVFPELSVPREWADGFAYKLAKQRVSMLAGLEYWIHPKGVRNDALVSLTTDWPWYSASISFIQPKLEPSH